MFVFGILEGRKDTLDTFGSSSSTKSTSNAPTGLIKIDFLPSDSHRLEFTGISNKSKTTFVDYDNAAAVTADPKNSCATSHVGTPGTRVQKGGGDVLIAKYTGYLTDNLTVSAQVGRATI